MARRRERPIHLTAEQARGGEIVLTTPARRAIFLAGLVGIVILVVLAGLVAMG